MKTLRSLLKPLRARGTASRFDRYYAGVLRPGSGYPTADEARRDLRTFQQGQSSLHGLYR